MRVAEVMERALERGGLGRDVFYQARALGLPELMPPVAELADLDEVLAALASEDALGGRGEQPFRRQRDRGARAIGVRAGGGVAHVSFVKPAEPHEVPPWMSLDRAWLVSNAYTLRAHRGRRLYPRVLSAIAATLPLGHEVVLFTDAWNTPSRRGVEAAGYRAFAVRQSVPVVGARWVRL